MSLYPLLYLCGDMQSYKSILISKYRSFESAPPPLPSFWIDKYDKLNIKNENNGQYEIQKSIN